MYLKGYEDSGDEIALSANSAILLPETGDVGYAEPASSAFDSQQAFITELENQMRNLGISTFSAKRTSVKQPRPRQWIAAIAIPCWRLCHKT